MLSNYSGEDEYLFFGGDWRIKIESIRHIYNGRNYKEFMDALFYFDCMLNGTSMYGEDPTDEQYEILQKLIKHSYKLGFDNHYDKYVNDTFDAFISHKTQIILNLNDLDDLTTINFKQFSELIMYSLSWDQTTTVEQHIIAMPGTEFSTAGEIKFYTNIFKIDVIFRLFKNLKEIVIYTTNVTGSYSYIMDLETLLDLIKFHESKFMIDDEIRIVIKATCRWIAWDDHEAGGYDCSWISNLWTYSEVKLRKLYHDKDWDIMLEKSNDDSIKNRVQDCLIICKSCLPPRAVSYETPKLSEDYL